MLKCLCATMKSINVTLRPRNSINYTRNSNCDRIWRTSFKNCRHFFNFKYKLDLFLYFTLWIKFIFVFLIIRALWIIFKLILAILYGAILFEFNNFLMILLIKVLIIQVTLFAYFVKYNLVINQCKYLIYKERTIVILKIITTKLAIYIKKPKFTTFDIYFNRKLLNSVLYCWFLPTYFNFWHFFEWYKNIALYI